MGKCSASLIELRNSFKRDIDEEHTGHSRYAEAAAKMAHFRVQKSEPLSDTHLSVFNSMLKQAAMDELAHAAMLDMMVEIIGRECGE